MNKISAVKEILDIKTIALSKAIEELAALSECNANTCDGSYHWRGCPKTLAPLLKELRAARDES